MSGRYLRFKIDVKSAKNDHSWVIFGASTPQHDLILVVLYVRSKVHFMNKLLSYGKDRVTVGEFRDICILKMVNFCPLMASTVPYHGYNFAKYFFLFLGCTWSFLDRICITRDLMYVFHYKIWNSTQKWPFCGEGGKKFIKIFEYRKTGITR